MQKKWINHLEESFSFHRGALEGREVFFFWGLRLEEGEGGLKPLKFFRKNTAIRSSPRGAKEFRKWFWFPNDDTLLLCWLVLMLTFDKGSNSRRSPTIWRKWEEKIIKQAQHAGMTGIMANGPTRIIIGKEEVNGPRKPKEWSSKPLGTIRANEKVNGPGMSRKWISKFTELA